MNKEINKTKNPANNIIARAAFVGFGEVNTPAEIIEKKCLAARKQLERLNIDITSYSIVTDDPGGKQAQMALDNIHRSCDFDALIICLAGWIPSWAVIKVTNEFAHKPMLLWGLTGYYENSKLYTTADQAGTSALRKVFEDFGYNFKYIFNSPGKHADKEKISGFLRACGAYHRLKKSKIGMMGFRDMNLYGTAYDPTLLRSIIGIEVEHFEMLEIIRLIEKISKKEISDTIDKIKSIWDFTQPVKDSTLKKGVEFYLALKNKIIEKKYDAVSLIDVDGMKKLANFPPAMIFTLISDELGVCTIPENDAPGSATQLISKYITGQISAYMEFYEFMEDRILAGVPDFVPSEIVSGKTKVTPTKFGELDEGILNISDVKTGDITLARLSTRKNRFIMHVLTGKAVKPGKWEEIGWAPPAPQLPGLEIIIDCPVEDFAQKVLSQHYIITYGNNLNAYRDLCSLLDIEMF